MDRLRVAELCASTSLFTDLGTGQPQEHGLATCLVAMRLADVVGVGAETARATFYTSLLRFIGCTADAHVAAETGGDEIRLFTQAAPVLMGSMREEMARMLPLMAESDSIPHRLKALVAMLADPGSKDRLLEAHCEVATRLATRIGLGQAVIDSLDAAYARWDGRGFPSGLAGEDIPVPIRIAIVARDIELWARDEGETAARQVLERRRGRAYAPEVVDAALETGIHHLRAHDGALWDQVLALEPTPWETLTGPEIDRGLEALGDFAELKSPMVAGRWRRVRDLLGVLDDEFTPRERRILERAATVFDVGIVGVPVRIWEAAEPGTAGWELSRLHPLWTRRALEHCTGMEPVAVTAGLHHERQDGSGYPGGIRGDLDRVAGRLAAAVLYDELTGGSPGKEPSSPAEAAEQMSELASAGCLPAEAVARVLTAAGQGHRIEIDRPAGLTEREVDVLRHLAGGMTNRQIATALGISAKTVGTHVEHIYAKAGVRTRAAATLFAIEERLVVR
ncbi:MAG TPA: HD domain-containing phosphohydrolase [Acidimicrobiia bacterium]|nr:HD domain-containing phosphohydrolase [Acidimicrobiia bacterium]